MNNYSHQLLDRFKLAMIPSLLMAVVTNVYIALVILYSGEYLVLLSPVFGTVLFVLLYSLLRSDRLTAKHTFYVGAYIVVAEVCVHTHFFGWESGFIYFLFLLPAVLLA